MGLDVTFDHKKALEKGMIFDYQDNGSPDEVQAALEEGLVDEGYIAYLEGETAVLMLPGGAYPYWREFHMLDNGNCVVRANKWGDFYEPLVNWLRANDIAWEEY